MSQRHLLPILLLTALICLPSSYADREKDIPLSEVPKNVLMAVLKAVPDIVLHEAEVMKTKKGRVYELEGIANGKAYEINVTADGELVRLLQLGWFTDKFDD